MAWGSRELVAELAPKQLNDFLEGARALELLVATLEGGQTGKLLFSCLTTRIEGPVVKTGE